MIRGQTRAILPQSQPILVFRGKVVLHVVDPSGVVFEKSFDVADESHVDVTPPPPPTPPTPAASIVIGPRPAPPNDPTPAWILGIGTFVAIGGGAGLAASLVGVGHERSTLRASCLKLNPKDADQCELASPDLIAEAQAARLALVTWKGVELASAITLGVGVVTAGVGVVWLVCAENHMRPCRSGRTRCNLAGNSRLRSRYLLRIGFSFGLRRIGRLGFVRRRVGGRRIGRRGFVRRRVGGRRIGDNGGIAAIEARVAHSLARARGDDFVAAFVVRARRLNARANEPFLALIGGVAQCAEGSEKSRPAKHTT